MKYSLLGYKTVILVDNKYNTNERQLLDNNVDIRGTKNNTCVVVIIFYFPHGFR